MLPEHMVGNVAELLSKEKQSFGSWAEKGGERGECMCAFKRHHYCSLTLQYFIGENRDMLATLAL